MRREGRPYCRKLRGADRDHRGSHAKAPLGVPLKGSFWTLAGATLLYVIASTAMGLLLSVFVRSQIAALFGTAILTLVPAVSFSGLFDPVSSLEGVRPPRTS